MQFTPFLAALLLAPLTVTADESTRFVKADDIVIPRALLNRAPAPELSPIREYAAPMKTSGKQARDILMGRAPTCADSTQFACTNSDGCCDIGTICGVYGGVEGCCRIGKNCTSTKSCESTEVDCGGGCCPSGSTCATDSLKCRISGPSLNSQCSTGYSPCAGQDVCCPTGVKCLADKKCQILCTSTDPICGDGCCKVGSVCNVSRGTCSSSGSSGSTIIKSSSPSSTAAASGSSAKSKPTNTSSEPEATPTATGIDDSISDSNSGYNSTKTSSSSPSKATAKSGATTTGGSGAKSTPSTSSNSGLSTSSGAERGVVVGMFGAAIVGVVAGLVMV